MNVKELVEAINQCKYRIAIYTSVIKHLTAHLPYEDGSREANTPIATDDPVAVRVPDDTIAGMIDTLTAQRDEQQVELAELQSLEVVDVKRKKRPRI